ASIKPLAVPHLPPVQVVPPGPRGGEDRGDHARGNHRHTGGRQSACIDPTRARSLIVTGLLPRLRGLRWIIAWFLGSSRLLRVLRGLSGVVGDGDRRRDLYPAVHPA